MLNLDTHILLWALEGELSRAEKKLLEVEQWGISSIVLWEVEKLFQLGRIGLDPLTPEFRRSLSSIVIWPIEVRTLSGIRKLDFRGDPADEIIAATSIIEKSPLVTRDRRILSSRIVPLALR